jgi:hypothetical protein
MTRKAALLLVIPALMLGCEESNDNSPRTNSSPSGSVSAPQIDPQQQQAVTTAEQKLQMLQSQLSQYRQQAANLTGDQKQKVMNGIDDATEHLNDAQEAINKLNKQKGDDWRDQNANVQEHLDKAQQSLNDIKTQLQSTGSTTPPSEPSTPPASEPPTPPGTGTPPPSEPTTPPAEPSTPPADPNNPPGTEPSNPS